MRGPLSAVPQKEDHLFGGVVEGSLGEGAVFRDRFESRQLEDGTQVRVGVVAEAEGFRFFEDEVA